MSIEELANFNKLKKKVQENAALSLGIRKKFVDWSLNDIRDFQADLEAKCKSSVSEKWFYLHFKNNSGKLPRVDVLHLLSQYCGYKNWEDFVFEEKEDLSKSYQKPIAITLLLLIVVAISVFAINYGDTKKNIIFEDAYTHELVKINSLVIEIKGKNAKILKDGGLIIKDLDTLMVSGPYYKMQMLEVQPDQKDTLKVTLFPDDYALMLNFFSRTDSDDWVKRVKQLEKVIHEDATLFQVHDSLNGIEMLNRDEFIERLVLPTKNLKNLEIQHIVYQDDKIYKLRFIQKEK